jgi:hypothetical protein
MGHRFDARDTKVIDLRRYRNANKAMPLPLFDDTPSAPRPVAIAPFRLLSAREVSHRARMLSHLRALPGARR